MSLSGSLLDSITPSSPDRVYGVVVAVATNTKDPDGLGRVKVKYPWLGSDAEGYWARVASPMAGKERGFYFLPDVNDEVLVAFEHGDIRFPYVVGALWNGQDKPPVNNDGKNNVRLIKSRSGHLIRLTDENGGEKIEIVDKTGKNSITIDTAKNSITLASEKDVTISAPNGAVKIEAQNVQVKSSGETKIESGAAMEAKAGASLTIKGSVVNIN